MIEVKNLVKNFKVGEVETKVIKDISLKIKSGEFVSIIGPSGSGKSTLLYLLSFLDTPTSGKVIINECQSDVMNEKKRTAYRLDNFGFVFQDYSILPELTALENVMLPALMRGISLEKAEKMSEEILDRLGLKESLQKVPGQLSGGQQQRVSIARALVLKPHVLFADEPTASLDEENSQEVIEVIKDLHKSGQTIILVTHEMVYAKTAKRIIHLRDGQIEKDQKVK